MFFPLDSDISQFVLINCLVFLSHVLWEKDVNIYFQRNFQFTLRSSQNRNSSGLFRGRSVGSLGLQGWRLIRACSRLKARDLLSERPCLIRSQSGRWG